MADKINTKAFADTVSSQIIRKSLVNISTIYSYSGCSIQNNMLLIMTFKMSVQRGKIRHLICRYPYLEKKMKG